MTANVEVNNLAMASQDTIRKRLLVSVSPLLSKVVLPEKASILKNEIQISCMQVNFDVDQVIYCM